MARPVLTGALWVAVVLAVLLGVGAAMLRIAFMGDLAARAEPVRTRLVSSFEIDDPYAAQRPAEVHRFDSRYAAHRVVALLHLVPGALFLLLAPLQFSPRIRERYIEFHRWSGRALLVAAFATAVSALCFGLFMPFAGWSEAAAIASFGALFLIALSRAFLAIRRHEVRLHREWMLRAFAIALGISTVRIVAAALDLALTPAGLTVGQIFALSLWIGWFATLGGAELWIRHTRVH